MPGCRRRAVWQAASWPPALSVEQHGLSAAHFSPPLPKARPPPCRETTDGGYGTQWQWDPRYGPCFTGQSHDRHRHVEKKESSLQQVNEGLLQRLDAEQVQRSEERRVGKRCNTRGLEER